MERHKCGCPSVCIYSPNPTFSPLVQETRGCLNMNMTSQYTDCISPILWWSPLCHNSMEIPIINMRQSHNHLSYLYNENLHTWKDKSLYKTSTLGSITPLSLPRSVYKSDIECYFLEFWVKVFKMTLKAKVNNTHFQYQQRVSIQI